MTGSASVGEALRSATEWLRASGSRSPRLDAELLLATALGVDRAELFRAPERVLTRIEERRFDGYLVRRQAREPVAYIRRRRAFRSIELEVTPAVLIPRPETETLVDVALEALADVPAGGDAAGGRYEPRVLDVGTGSGCIALALAAENPFVRVVATDVSAAAVEVARRNAARLGLGGRLDVRCGDLLDDLLPRERFDLIVSNPPYIPEAEYRTLEPNVRDYEPRLALHGGEDGLDVARRLIAAAAGRLRPGGVLAVEVGAGQAAAVGALFAAAGAFAAAQQRADLVGIPRVVFAHLSTRDAGG
jgi:release factor glutamine methyltransferase